MKTIEEALDNVLQSLVKNDGTIPHFMDEAETTSYTELFTALQLSVSEFIELLDILKSESYIKYMTIEQAGLEEEFYQKISQQPFVIWLTLKGKFFILNGGYEGEISKRNEEKDRIKKQDEQMRILTILLAIGSIGVLLIEVFKFLLDYF